MNNRITLDDSFLDAIIKIADGNIGAASALPTICAEYPKIDPQAAFAELAPLLALDTLGIYGSEVWVLWKDVCDFNVRTFVMLLRAHQLGLVPHTRLKQLSNGRDNGVGITQAEIDVLDAKVCEQLDQFQRKEAST